MARETIVKEKCDECGKIFKENDQFINVYYYQTAMSSPRGFRVTIDIPTPDGLFEQFYGEFCSERCFKEYLGRSWFLIWAKELNRQNEELGIEGRWIFDESLNNWFIEYPAET